MTVAQPEVQAMSINMPLLERTLRHIEAHPEQWDQKTWYCGTAGCFAWHAAVLAGGEPLPNAPAYVRAEDDDPPEHVYPCGTFGLVETAVHETAVHVADRATRVLGLPDDSRLFAFNNTLDDLRRIVEDLARRAAS